MADQNFRRFAGSWQWGGWFLRIGNKVIALKGPRCRALFTERNRRGVRVLPLIAGWRVTVRDV